MIRDQIAKLALGDLLRTLQNTGQSAAVTLGTTEAYGRTNLSQGRIVYARTEPGPHLGEYFVRLGSLELQQIQELIKGQSTDNPGTPLEQTALPQNLISKAKLEQALNLQVQEALVTMLSWRKGGFSAVAVGPNASQIVLPHTLDYGTIVLEATRKLDEWRRGRVDSDQVFILTGDPALHPLSPKAWGVLELVGGVKRTRSLTTEVALPEEDTFLPALRTEKSRSDQYHHHAPRRPHCAGAIRFPSHSQAAISDARARTLPHPDRSPGRGGQGHAQAAPTTAVTYQGEALAEQRTPQVRGLPEGRFCAALGG